jgi:hypothetical protein
VLAQLNKRSTGSGLILFALALDLVLPILPRPLGFLGQGTQNHAVKGLTVGEAGWVTSQPMRYRVREQSGSLRCGDPGALLNEEKWHSCTRGIKPKPG